jgi:hypothetical protein
VKISPQEKKALTALKRLEKLWPRSLWVFAANGRFIVMKTNEAGERVMTHRGGGTDPGYIVEDFCIPCDGGDW